MHLSNIAGKLGGGVSKVVQALLKHQNLNNLNSDLWFFGSKKIINEVENDTNVKSRKINALGKNIFKLPFSSEKLKKVIMTLFINMEFFYLFPFFQS